MMSHSLCVMGTYNKVKMMVPMVVHMNKHSIVGKT
jgi:hypothetical protein